MGDDSDLKKKEGTMSLMMHHENEFDTLFSRFASSDLDFDNDVKF